MIMDALIYGVIESEKKVACERAPPVRMFIYSRKLPSVAFVDIHSCTVAISRNGTVIALPILNTMIIMRVYRKFLRISGTLHAFFSV
jgi:hypothetical protein